MPKGKYAYSTDAFAGSEGIGKWCVFFLVFILKSQIAAWIFYTKGLYPGSINFALIPFINLILLVIMFMMSDKLR